MLTILETSLDVLGSTVHTACSTLVSDQEVMSFVYCALPTARSEGLQNEYIFSLTGVVNTTSG